MELLKSGIQWVLDLGASVMLPIMLTIFGLVLRQGFKKSFRSGIMIGIGFIGINLVIGLLMSSVGEAATAMVDRLGVNLDILDVGWPIGASITFATPIAMILIPIIFIVNIILLFTNFTKTMDVDIWNYWHLIYAGAIAYYFTNSLAIAILVAIIHMAIVFKLADWTAPVLEHHFKLPGISLPHAETINFAPIMYTLNKIEDKIPGLNKLNADPDSIRKKIGFLGEPIMMGLILGLILGFLAGYDLKNILTLAISMSAVLILMPKMVALLMEGLIPLSEGCREFIQKRFPNKEVYIGLDAAIVIGHPANMTVALLMIPVTILLAVILPFNRMLPFADLAVLPFTVIWAVAASRGNIVRGMINATIGIIIVLFIATNIAELTTVMGQAAGFQFPEGANLISGIDIGSHVIGYIILKLLDFKNSTSIIIGIVLAIIYALLWIWTKNDIKKQYASEE